MGDWVAFTPFNLDEGLIHAVLPRRSVFARKAAGSSNVEQIVAANLDRVFLAMALNQDYNLRRLERYLALAWESGADPVVVLTKADLCHDLDARGQAVAAIAGIVPVIVTSSLTGAGLDLVRALVEPGRTAAILGSSGAGKSTLINRLLGAEHLVTQPIREDDGRGRHTTTRRELMLLPGGGLILDTPGMRELGLWDGACGLEAAFDDVEALTEACRFRDCEHGSEPGCAVQAALCDGALSRVPEAPAGAGPPDTQATRADAARSTPARQDSQQGDQALLSGSQVPVRRRGWNCNVELRREGNTWWHDAPTQRCGGNRNARIRTPGPLSRIASKEQG